MELRIPKRLLLLFNNASNKTKNQKDFFSCLLNFVFIIIILIIYIVCTFQPEKKSKKKRKKGNNNQPLFNNLESTHKMTSFKRKLTVGENQDQWQEILISIPSHLSCLIDETKLFSFNPFKDWFESISKSMQM